MFYLLKRAFISQKDFIFFVCSVIMLIINVTKFKTSSEKETGQTLTKSFPGTPAIKVKINPALKQIIAVNFHYQN